MIACQYYHDTTYVVLPNGWTTSSDSTVACTAIAVVVDDANGESLEAYALEAMEEKEREETDSCEHGCHVHSSQDERIECCCWERPRQQQGDYG